ncbi:2-(5'-triphosphoribosyl)-3'-dephospho CoA synthase [Vibrio sinaloensis]|uniref:Probable 2-(5''-triphosphoribosyl)-3'-dephosphocoenzyme-A synthase n=2 Tax=Photobacterium sp. (strain ATCC 43367) TaxID=379097 RepID=A0A0A5HXB4_PHOS4|nr:triphosphoribosyl-dephospho-CoA synthase CitG [Vibrio sinaloensis]KGY08161.1 2-(5'-triphosphoribosyl)-3'-dephospho CoA synthase [Vibrio sinaloensis]
MHANKTLEWLMDDCSLYEPDVTGRSRLNICVLAGNLAYHAMMLEVHLTPKPGLVDCANSGAHSDMDLKTFVASCDALRPYMKEFVRAGFQSASLHARDLLEPLRRVGLSAEMAMNHATQGVNTHKGMIFTLGVICGAVGWLHRKGISYDSKRVRAVIKECCSGLVQEQLRMMSGEPKTAGERLFVQYGFTGIRGEAQQGYPTIFNHGLPAYHHSINRGESEEKALSIALLALMANNQDTNVVNRAGLPGLKFVKAQAKQILASPITTHQELESHLQSLDERFIKRNISPGGSADLLAATWLLAQLDICSQVLINKQVT